MREVRSDTVESEQKPVSRFSRWSGIILMTAILGVAGIVSALTAMRFAIRGREVEVPPLSGKTADEAKEILSHSGLLLKVSSSRFSSEVLEGHILDQTPSSGTRLKVNRTVRVLLSLGERRFLRHRLSLSLAEGHHLQDGSRAVVLHRCATAHGATGARSLPANR